MDDCQEKKSFTNVGSINARITNDMQAINFVVGYNEQMKFLFLFSTALFLSGGIYFLMVQSLLYTRGSPLLHGEPPLIFELSAYYWLILISFEWEVSFFIYNSPKGNLDKYLADIPLIIA